MNPLHDDILESLLEYDLDAIVAALVQLYTPRVVVEEALTQASIASQR